MSRRLAGGVPVTSPSDEELYPLFATWHQHLDEEREVHRLLSRMMYQAVPAVVLERLPDHIYSVDWPWPPPAA